MRRILAIAWASAIIVSTKALEVGTSDQIKTSAKAIANQLVALYPSTNLSTWWEGGAIYGGLIDYSQKTGDASFDALIAQQVAAQAGSEPPYFQPTNGTTYGQARWALTATLANEVKYPSDPSLPLPYLELAEAVFNQIASRWDTETCDGGLNTAISSGQELPTKDTFSAGEFFQLASRLAIKTQNGTYTFWAERIFEWATGVGLIDTSNNWDVYNLADPVFNCTSVDKTEWSVNAGELLYGCALMYNLTFSQSWVTRTTGLLTYINTTFFSNNIVFEPSCAGISCSPGQRTYRALLVKFMAKSAMVAPFITAPIQAMLAQNGQAVAGGCADPVKGNSTCMINGLTGMGEQLTALNSVVSLLIGRAKDSGSMTTTVVASSPKATSAGNGRVGVAWSLMVTCVFLMVGFCRL